MSTTQLEDRGHQYLCEYKIKVFTNNDNITFDIIRINHRQNSLRTHKQKILMSHLEPGKKIFFLTTAF